MMAFHKNSVNINLRQQHTLCCRCERPNGTWSFSQLDLNHCLGNENGAFFWGGHSFAHSATGIRLSLEGPGKGAWLHAELNDHDGVHQCASVNLSECVQNHNGVLRFSPHGPSITTSHAGPDQVHSHAVPNGQSYMKKPSESYRPKANEPPRPYTKKGGARSR